MSEKKVLFPGVKDGDVFEVAGVEFIKFPDQNGMTPVVAKDVLFTSVFGDSNHFAESKILDRLNKELLPKIEEAVGAENLCEFETDLTTLCGLKVHGCMRSRIALPTFDFYRKNIEIFDKHPVKRWWWTATPDSAKPHDDPDWVVCVAPSGGIDGDDCVDDYNGVRPFLNFVSDIFGSLEE
jgi:hypothetical protein